MTNRVSYLVLEAAHRLKIPANVGVCVGAERRPRPAAPRRRDPVRGQDGHPQVPGHRPHHRGLRPATATRSRLARQRAYSGCHWFALPGREYTLNDCVKINFAAVFEVALHEMLADPDVAPVRRRAVAALRSATCGGPSRSSAEGLDFHLEHMHEVFPELVLDLLCHGPDRAGPGCLPRRRRVLQPVRRWRRRWPPWPIPSPPSSSASSGRDA